MKQQPINRILKSAQKRAVRARQDTDGKRHDQVKRQEQKDMAGLFAYYQSQGADAEEAARKVARDLKRDMDTVKRHLKSASVLGEDSEHIPAQVKGAGRALLKIENPSVGLWTDKEGRTANYATVEVTNEGHTEAKGIWGRADIPGKGSFPLHPAGAPYTWGEATAPKIDLLPGIPARWDLAFALPPLSLKQVPKGMTSGQVASLIVRLDGKLSTAVAGTDNNKWQGQGCWAAYPLALWNPEPGMHGFLPPGTYQVTVTVGCDNGDGDVRSLELVSPQLDWEGLGLKGKW